MKKNILFTANTMCIGGIEKSLIELLKALNKDYNITVVLEKLEGELLKDIPNNVTIQEVKVSNNRIVIIRKLINILRKVFWSIRNYNKYDFSCCYATYSMSSNVLARIGSKNNVIYIHNDYSCVYDEKEYRSFFDNKKLEKFRKIIFVSNESKDNFIIKYPNFKNKCLVINNLINYKKIQEKANEVLDITINNKSINFLYVGRLDEHQKRISRAIEGINYLIKQGKNVKFYIVGDGPDKNKYEKLIKKNNLNNIVYLLGNKENPYKYIKFADYIIFTSEYEGFPVVYNESLVLKKTIITTIPLSDEKIDIRNYGYVISKEIDKIGKELENIINIKQKKQINLDFIKINNNRINKIKKIIDE